MSYGNKYSNKPFEGASKTGHTNIINDEIVKNFLGQCHIPPFTDNMDNNDLVFTDIENIKANPVKNIIAIDGGYTNVIVKAEFPSSTIAFFQFGALFFKFKDLLNLKKKPFIDPDDFSKLQNIQRIKLVLPTKGISLKGEKDLLSSVRKTIYDFFMNSPEKEGLISSLKWLIFEEFNVKAKVIWHLSSCPCCNEGIDIDKTMIKSNYTVSCPSCNEILYLTDTLRLHEDIDNELGAGGVLGYLSTAIEHLLIVFLIKSMLETKPSLLKETMIIKDGPLAFFGLTANIHTPMRKLVEYLYNNYGIFLVGLEKSGSFVEHADSISNKIDKQKALILTNKYIYKYIIPGQSNESAPYGRSTYYGHKVIFKSKYDNIYVATVPTLQALVKPSKNDLLNMDVILNNISALKCDLYYNSLVPIVLANKLVSLADHPSADLLKHFAQETIN